MSFIIDANADFVDYYDIMSCEGKISGISGEWNLKKIKTCFNDKFK